MANTPKLLAQVTLAAGSNTVYTSPAATTTIINYIAITNTDTVTRTVDIDVGDSGSEMKWRDDLSILTKDTIEWSGAFTIEENDVLKMTPSAGSVVDVIVSGLQVT